MDEQDAQDAQDRRPLTSSCLSCPSMFIPVFMLLFSDDHVAFTGSVVAIF